ncbi:MAG TPA: hypothetical protein VII50_07880 [Acidothermaceae bacterium]
MSPSNKRSLAIVGSVLLIGHCVAAFFIGKHAGSRGCAACGADHVGYAELTAALAIGPSIQFPHDSGAHLGAAVVRP